MQAHVQETALARGRTVVSCSAAPGAGGLGRHLEEFLAALARRHQPTVCVSGATRDSDARARPRRPATGGASAPHARLLARLPLAGARGWRTRNFFAEFDAYAARCLPQADALIAFNGQALTQLRAARRAGYESIAVVAANSHFRRLLRQHALAHRQ